MGNGDYRGDIGRPTVLHTSFRPVRPAEWKAPLRGFKLLKLQGPTAIAEHGREASSSGGTIVSVPFNPPGVPAAKLVANSWFTSCRSR